MTDHRRSPARLLAPLALVAFALALTAVVVGSREESDDGGVDRTPAAAERRRQSTAATGETTPRRTPASYTVRTGDTLGSISQKTGVTVERIQELNPEIDPQVLVTGQRIKLVE